MKEHIKSVALWLVNLGAWTINDLSLVEMILKLVLLILSIALAVRQLCGKQKIDK